MNGPAAIGIQDTDGNGTRELVLKDNGPVHLDTLHNFGPWRGKQVVFTWDGIHFLYSSLEIDPPIYRFQAVQDADRYFLTGDYDRALQLYQDAIFSDALEWWSKDRMRYLSDAFSSAYSGAPAPIPPDPDYGEYQALSAYARYRILVLYAVQGWMTFASQEFEAIRTKFPEGEIGHPYAVLATEFWTGYERSGDLAAACSLAVSYAREHPEILGPLGDINHGLQSHIYAPEDICPLK